MLLGVDADSVPFVGRASEAAAVRAAASRHLQGVDAGAALIEAGVPRVNVLSLYGPAGVGKTRLMSHLAEWLATGAAPNPAWGAPPLPRGEWRSCRIDLQDAWSIDNLLLRLRGMAGGDGVELRAFDLALAARLAIVRPGEFPTALRVDPTGPLRNLRGEIQQGASLALTELGVPGGLGAGALLRVLDVLRARRKKASTMAACPYLQPALEDILRAGTDESAAGLGRLLAWDLSFISAERRPGLAVLVDTYETVQHHDRHAERLLNALIWSTPSILWIVAGHEPLDWAAAPVGVLPYRGNHVWPGLRGQRDAGGIHRIGPLSAEEVSAALAAADIRVGARVKTLDVALQASIRDAAAGLPLYVALALETARDAVASGEDLRVEMFGGPLVGMTGRILRGLPHDEREALRAATLLTAFDAELASIGGGVSKGAGERLTQRSLVDGTGSPPLPFRLHAAFRAAIRSAPPDAVGSWAEEDWSAAATRLIAALQERHNTLRDPDERLALIVAAYELSATAGVEALWLIRAALQDQPRTEAVARLLVGRVETRSGSWASSFERLLGVWLVPRGASLEHLRTLAEDPGASPPVRRSAYRRLAYHLRADSHHEEVERVLAALRALPEGGNRLHRYQHALTLIHLGRFRAAQVLIGDLRGSAELTKPGGWVDRLNGELRLQHGDLATAADANARRRAFFEGTGSLKLTVELQVAEARLRALLDPQSPTIDRGIELATRHAMLPDLRTAWCAKALAVAGDADAVAGALAQAMTVARQGGLRDRTYSVVLAEWFHAAVTRDDRRLGALKASCREGGSPMDARWRRPIEWWRAWALDEDPPKFDEIEWLESEAVVRARWIAVVQARRRALGLG